MTLLGETALAEVLGSGALIVAPLLDPETQIGPGSIDLRLGTEFLLSRRTRSAGVDPMREGGASPGYDRVEIDFGAELWLQPGQLALGSTLETIRLGNDLGAYVLSRSTWGRLGLFVATAVFVQPGFCGVLTLELVNAGETPIALYAGTRVAQLVVHRVDGETTGYLKRASSSYKAPTGPQSPDLESDRREVLRANRALKALRPPQEQADAPDH